MMDEKEQLWYTRLFGNPKFLGVYDFQHTFLGN